MVDSLPLGAFTCQVTLGIVRPVIMERHDEGGVTTRTSSGYELTYTTELVFSNGMTLPVTVSLFGEGNKQIVIRDDRGAPQRIVGYAQGRSEVRDGSGDLIFVGHYYDTRLAWDLKGDDALTPHGVLAADHWENSFGKGAYAGHAFSLGVHFSTVAGSGAPMTGEARGRID